MPKKNSYAPGPVMLDIAGVELQADEKDVLSHPQVGGLILFSRNFENSAQLQGLLRQVREVRSNLVVSVDHEGGRVQRFRDGFTVLPPMQTLGDAYERDAKKAGEWAADLGWLMAAELLAHDIDISFAPVLDLDHCHSDIIGNRAFSASADVACAVLAAFIEGMHDAGMATTGKHFPGHGGVKADSHKELPVDPRTLDELEAHDLIPFRALHTRLDAVMSAHIMFPNVDEELVSFSEFWIKTFLRETMGYEGIVFSDDLSMEGAAGVGDYPQRARLALNAGCDVVLVCNNAPAAISVIEALEVQGGAPGAKSLAPMMKRKQRRMPELQKLPRYKRAREIVDALTV